MPKPAAIPLASIQAELAPGDRRPGTLRREEPRRFPQFCCPSYYRWSFRGNQRICDRRRGLRARSRLRSAYRPHCPRSRREVACPAGTLLPVSGQRRGVRIVLRKGSYVPEFQLRMPPANPLLSRVLRSRAAAGVAGTILLLCPAVFYWNRRHRRSASAGAHIVFPIQEQARRHRGDRKQTSGIHGPGREHSQQRRPHPGERPTQSHR